MERKPDVEGDAGDFANPTVALMNYLNNLQFYRARGVDPTSGAGVGIPQPVNSAPTAAEVIAESTTPTIASRTFPVKATPQNADISSVTGTSALLSKLGYVWDEASKSWVQKAADLAKGATDGTPGWLEGVLKAMAGIAPAIAASQMKQGPSDEEKAYQAQATRLLKQQEQRTQFQNPLYETITRMAYGLQPTMGTQGQPYRYNTLDDVKVP